MPTPKMKPAQPEAAAPAPKNLVQLSIPTPAGDAANEAMTAVTYAESFTIADASDSAKAQEARAKINTKIKALNDARLALTRPIDVAKKTIMDFFAGPVAQFERAKVALDRKIIAYDNAQEELRRAEQRRLDAIAETERRRLQAIADEDRRKSEAKAEQLRKDAEAAIAAGRADDAARLAARAVRVEEKSVAKVEQLEERASSIVATVAQADTARVAGTSFRETPEFEILTNVDPQIVIGRVAKIISNATGAMRGAQALAEELHEAGLLSGPINAQFMTPDTVKIGRVVRSLGLDAVGVVGPGIKVEMRKGLASRRT